MIKKLLGGAGAVLSFALLTAAAAGLITWRLFWLGIITIGAFAYWILPYVFPEEEFT